MSFFQALVAEQESKDSGGASIAEQVLSIMEIILDEANAEISEDKVLVYHRFMHLSEKQKFWALYQGLTHLFYLILTITGLSFAG